MEMAQLTPGPLTVQSLGSFIPFDCLRIAAECQVTIALFLEMLRSETPEENHPLYG